MNRLLLVALFLAACSTVQAQEFPFSPGSGELRIVTWNIENLGSRTPRRSDEELELLAERIASFEAPVIAVQEIGSGTGRARPALEQVLANLGPDWRAVTADTSNGFIFDSRVVELLSSEQLDQLQSPPYNTFYIDFPSWQIDFGFNGDPFTAGRSLPMTAEFRVIGTGSALPIRLLSSHFHAGSDFDLQRSYEGQAIQAWTDEILQQESANSRIYLLGDFNAQPGDSPHTELGMVRLEKENTIDTGILSEGEIELDHIYATADGFPYVSRGTTFVIQPEHYSETPVEFEAIYSDHAPVLADMNLAALAYSGSWYDPEHDGEGFMVQMLEDGRAYLTWYTYDDQGQQMWLTGVGDLNGSTVVIDELYVTAGGVFGPGFDPEAVELTPWGSLVFTFDTCTSARVDYESGLGFGSGSLNPIRLTAIEGLECP
jgi:endonuclease/exonuclease/phosphatase family metal-dependent hydrolase